MSSSVAKFHDAALYTFKAGTPQVVDLADTTSSALTVDDSSSTAFYIMTGYKKVTIPISTTGTDTIGFLSMQPGDDDVSSGTYISNVAGIGTLMLYMNRKGLVSSR